MLEKRQAESMSRNLLFNIIDAIHTPRPPPSPIDAFITDEEKFERLNPGVSHTYFLIFLAVTFAAEPMVAGYLFASVNVTKIDRFLRFHSQNKIKLALVWLASAWL